MNLALSTLVLPLVAVAILLGCNSNDEDRLSGWRAEGSNGGNNPYQGGPNGQQGPFGNGNVQANGNGGGGFNADLIDPNAAGPETVFPEFEQDAKGCVTHRVGKDVLRQRSIVNVTANQVITNVTAMSSPRSEVNSEVANQIGYDVKRRVPISELFDLSQNGQVMHEELVYTDNINNSRVKVNNANAVHTFSPPIPFFPKTFQTCQAFAAISGYSINSTITSVNDNDARSGTMTFTAVSLGEGRCRLKFELTITDNNGAFYENLAIPAVQEMTFDESNKVYFDPTYIKSYFSEPARRTKETSELTYYTCRVSRAAGVLGVEDKLFNNCEKPDPSCS